MRPIDLSRLTKGGAEARIMASGPLDVVILQHIYDPKQMWLPIGTFIFNADQDATPIDLLHAHNASKSKLKTALNRKYVWNEGVAFSPYERDPTSEQLLLKLPGALRLSNSKLKRVAASKWNGWELINGEPCVVEINSLNNKEVIDWCQEHCWNFFNVQGNYPIRATFASSVDAVACKLAWG